MRTPANPITEEMLSYYVYDETSPSCLRWKETRYATVGIGPGQRLVVTAGDVAGHLRKDGYWSVKLFSKSIKNHRIIFCMHHGVEGFENVIVDHENGDNSDNKISNLLPSTDNLNGKNKAKYGNNSTGQTGVHINEKCPGKYYYVATWREADQTIGAKSFSFSKYGKDVAFQMACEYREAKMKQLILDGVPYSVRHGQ